jgi:hypothetical protein
LDAREALEPAVEEADVRGNVDGDQAEQVKVDADVLSSTIRPLCEKGPQRLTTSTKPWAGTKVGRPHPEPHLTL